MDKPGSNGINITERFIIMTLPTPNVPVSQPKFTAEEVEKHVRGLDASAELIRKLIADNQKTPENLDTMSRNVRHLQIMMAFDSIKNSEWDLTDYDAAIAEGNAWMA